MAEGLRSSVGVACSPYTKGPYTWDQSLSFGTSSTDVISITAGATSALAGSQIAAWTTTASTSGFVFGMRSQLYVNASTTGSNYAFRGETIVNSGKTVTSGYVVGVQGKWSSAGTIAASTRCAAVLAQIGDGAGTMTGASLFGLWVDNQLTATPSSARFAGIGIDQTVASCLFDSMISFYGYATNLFDFAGDGGSGWIVAAAVGGNQDKKLKCKVAGTTYYIPLNSA